jgi:hypothetical protein
LPLEPPLTTIKNHHKENIMSLYENPTSDGRPNFYMGGTQVDKTNNGRVFFMADAAGTQAYKTHSHRGYIVSLEWVGTGARTAPCMVIWPERTSLADAVEASAWCIGRAAITEFVDGTAPTVKCIHEARDALRTLGKDQSDEQALSALVEAVVKFSPEWMLMPATPQPANQQAFSEAA